MLPEPGSIYANAGPGVRVRQKKIPITRKIFDRLTPVFVFTCCDK
jgi:hypothetical protein